MKCQLCGKSFPVNWKNPITNKFHNLCNRKYCLECSPFKEHNNKTLDINKELGSKDEKKCIQCEKIKPNAEFYSKGGSRKEQLTSYCKVCLNQLTVDKQRQRKLQAIEYLGGKCKLCGYSKCAGALEFHHKDPNEKEFALSASRMTSFEKSKPELDKCILLCANCHREQHCK